MLQFTHHRPRPQLRLIPKREGSDIDFVFAVMGRVLLAMLLLAFAMVLAWLP